MTIQSSVNLTPATGTAYVLNLINFLVNDLGFTRPRCGDGTTYDATGALVTHAGSGAGGLGNTGAWVEVVAPDGSFAYVFQRGTVNANWRIKVAPGAFAAGSPDGNSPGSNADEATRLGGGTDASPSYGALLTTDNTYKQHLYGDDAAPFGFYSLGSVNTTGVDTGFIMHDPVVETPNADLRAWVSAVAQAGTPHLTTSLNSTTAYLAGWLGFATTPAFQQLAVPILSVDSGTTLIPNGIGSNSNDGNDDNEWVRYYRRGGLSAPNGKKGRSTFMRLSGRTVGNMVSGGATGAAIDRIYIGDVVLPYPDVTPLV